jgi:hypothetical protein
VRLAAVVVVGVVLAGGAAAAKSSREVPYPQADVWPALLRFLRIDEKLTIVEKDGEAGYVLFEIEDGKKTYRGSAEVAKAGDATRVIVTIKDRPAYTEEGLLDRFEAKLKGEHPHD